jgi:hypothetical protein
LLFWNCVPSNRFRNAVPARFARKKPCLYLKKCWLRQIMYRILNYSLYRLDGIWCYINFPNTHCYLRCTEHSVQNYIPWKKPQESLLLGYAVPFTNVFITVLCHEVVTSPHFWAHYADFCNKYESYYLITYFLYFQMNPVPSLLYYGLTCLYGRRFQFDKSLS